MTSDARPHLRTTRPLLFLLPALLLLVLSGIAVGLARIAPSRVTTGVYQVVVWEGRDHVEIPAESLDCRRAGDTTTCTAPVGQGTLTVGLEYTGVVEPGACTAEYDGTPVACLRQMGSYGHASHTLWLPGGLGLSGAQQAELRDQVPWWRAESDLTDAGLASIVALGLATGLVTFLLRTPADPAPRGLRVALVIGTACLGVGLLAATNLVLDPPVGGVMLVVSPFSVLPVAAIAAWQWELTGPPLGGRTTSAVVAGGAATMYSGVALIVFALQSGFID